MAVLARMNVVFSMISGGTELSIFLLLVKAMDSTRTRRSLGMWKTMQRSVREKAGRVMKKVEAIRFTKI